MWQSDFVEVNGLRLHYTRTGSGDGRKSSVVLAHGFSDDGLCWSPLAEVLAPDYDVIMVDARGHGKSDAPEQGYGQVDMASDLAGVITALGLHRPAILGHSMGGATTYVLAGTYPDLPGAILIEDSGAINLGSSVPTEEQKKRWEGMRRWVEGLKRQTKEELMAGQRASTPHWSEEELLLWADSKHRMSVRVLNRSDAAPVDWPSLLPNIACPALLITGDTDKGAMVSAEGAKQLQSLIPGLQLAPIAGAGHCIRRDRPEEYLTVVRDFLRASGF
jgi:pimeloyl-ACP methyl ester carboxylesterase